MPQFSSKMEYRVSPVIFSGQKFDVDQFPSTEFFFSAGHMQKKDYIVSMTSSPEVQQKMAEYMMEREVQGFDPSVSDEEVMKSIDSKYNTMASILSGIANRINELRNMEARKAAEGDDKPTES